MADNTNRSLKVFLCHASDDKSAVQQLYSRLIKDGVDAWLDKEKLIPGQNWKIEIQKTVRNSDIVIVCLSAQSMNKEGFVQKEIKIALDTADEKPEGTIFIIPARLENCDVPERINQYQWVDLFSDNGYEWLMKALQLRANTLGAKFKVVPTSSTFGVTIVTPEDYDRVDRAFPVSGTYKNLPEGYHLWVSTFGIIYDNAGKKIKHYWPQEKATTENGKWHSRVYNIGGVSGESKEFLVLAVGKEGQALIKHFKDVGNETQQWPPIKKLTSDIIECAIGKIKLK